MKKYILMLLLTLSITVALDFTMTEEGLFANNPQEVPDTETARPEILSSTNNYLESINLPSCDKNNPEVQFIRTLSDWKHINDTNKKIFCISPGDYRSLGNIQLKEGGTHEKRRYIILNNGNNSHPGKINKNQLANYSIRIMSNYWTIDRFANWNTTTKASIIIHHNSSYNIINRAFTDSYTRAVEIGNNSNNNTVQKSRFQNMKPSAMNDDQVSIDLAAWKIDTFVIKNTKIISNEIVTSNDGIQLTRGPKHGGSTYSHYQEVNAEGTIIYDNDIYQNPNTMGNGKGENAIDMKAGSENPSNPIIIAKNRIWNWLRSTTGGEGSAMVFHMSPKNIKIHDNIIFNSGVAFVTGPADPVYGYRNGLIDSEIYNNIIYHMSFQGGVNRVFTASSMIRTDIHHNTFIENTNKKGLIPYNSDNSFFRNNTLISPVSDYVTTGSDSTFINSLSSNIDYQNTQEAGLLKSYTFTTDKFTNNPRKIILKNVIKSN